VNREHVLFVCTANIDRSRTAEDLYRNDPRYEVRSAGTASFATRRVDAGLLAWADRVFVMNERFDRHATLLQVLCPGHKRPVVDLDVEDLWPRGHPELVRRILRSLASHLGAPRDADQSRS